MKKIKFLLALVITVAMLSTVSFAAIGDCELNIDATKAYSETMTFDITLANDLSLDSDGYLGFTLTFDSAAWSATGSSETLDNVVNKSNYIDCLMEGETTLTAGTVILTVTANVVDAEAAIGSKFVIKNLEAYDSQDDYAYVSGDYKSLAVKAGSKTVGATVEKITAEDWTWTDATAYKVSTTVEGTVTEVNCALNASYKLGGVEKSKEIYNASLAGIYATEGSTISFRPILLGTDTITDLVVTGTFTLK